jgi:hypothetical protein
MTEIIHCLVSHFLSLQSVMTPFKFHGEKGAIILSEAKAFQLLLLNIRNHLFRSESTRSVFVDMAKQFYSNASKDVQDACLEPTDDDFYEYVLLHWPSFRSFLDDPNTLKWGYVIKGHRMPNEINILSDLVQSGELAVRFFKNLLLALG